MSTEGRIDMDVDVPDPDVKTARQKVVERVTALILASADVLEAEGRKVPWEEIDVQSLIRHQDVDPELIRGFVHTPVYKWVTHDYVTGNVPDHLLCRIVEILHELAPAVFRRPEY